MPPTVSWATRPPASGAEQEPNTGGRALDHPAMFAAPGSGAS